MRIGVKGGQLKVLSRDELEAIYLAILGLLEGHGVRIEERRALDLLKEAGADVDYKGMTATFPQYLVEEALDKAPARIRLCGRDRGQDFVMEDRKVYFGTCSGLLYILDHETGMRRKTEIRDTQAAAKVCDALDQLDFAMALFTPLDVPEGTQGLYEEWFVMANTVKHAIIYAYHGREITRKQIEIARLIAGGEEELRKRPIVTMYDEPASPLIFGRDYVEALLEWTGAGLPIIWAPCPMSGATAPVTLAGNLVTGMAESLAGNVIAQLNNPGTPFICGFIPLVMDMRTSLSSYGAPENLLMGVAEAQLAHYLGLPLWGTGGCTDAKMLNAQTFIEVSMNLTTAALGGQSLIHDVGLMEAARTGALELLPICDEIIAMLKRFMRGMEVNDDTLAVEISSRVGHGGNFLGQEHTRRHFPKEHWIPRLIDRSFSYEMWMKMGGRDMVEKAREEVKRILREHEVEPIPKDIRREVEGIFKEAAHP